MAGAARLVPAPNAIRFGTTTTVEQSGALAIADSLWRGAPLAKLIGPSAMILESAAAGDLDVIITHAPALEAKFLGGGKAELRCPFVSSRFAIVGPANDPANVAWVHTAAEAMQRIARAGAGFVSRGDSSGTHMKELALWNAAGVNPPRGGWYVESGLSQATTLSIADQRQVYALADLPTFTKQRGLRLRILFARDTALQNPYTLYVVRHSPPHPAVHQFVSWALDAWRARLVARRLPDGTAAFVARKGGCAPMEDGATSLVGLWELVPRPQRERADSGPALGAGLQISLEIDSASADHFSGRVTRWFAGDASLRPSNFGRLKGQTSGLAVTLVIPFTHSSAAPIAIDARRTGADTLDIIGATRGDEAGPVGAGALFVRRRRGPVTGSP